MRFGVAAVLALALYAAATRAQADPLFASGGTGTILHPLQEPTNLRLPASCYDGTGRLAKEHVYIFGINGLNPMCLGNFNGMLDYVRRQGFQNTHFGQMYTYTWYANNIREIRRRDPQAKIVLVGFSLGCNSVRDVANQLKTDGTKVDLLVYLVGDFIYNSPDTFPPNVGRVVNVRAQGLVLVGGDLMFNGADIDRAVNLKLDCRHILVPSRKETLKLVTEELLALACFPVNGALQLAPLAAPPAVTAKPKPVTTSKPTSVRVVPAPPRPTYGPAPSFARPAPSPASKPTGPALRPATPPVRSASPAPVMPPRAASRWQSYPSNRWTTGM